ncbi:hypothetical protein GGTG_05897 [Gaeumannomyces tritici R3-111a-1]|uniref:Uncharacterized protein n=1 Tax=Gaeumannomyces tritici (strain R3-111a-1) TaxID=644352 RepID=J3NX90_GAET3|nr:hypothetical protein GGTG_05897 [Gaeumannomyces tritici R3-111a-1]EJT75972.1 hypothetical protein GGTG_05897 [Gaeumannomyces tritici R3-111a-1]
MTTGSVAPYGNTVSERPLPPSLWARLLNLWRESFVGDGRAEMCWRVGGAAATLNRGRGCPLLGRATLSNIYARPGGDVGLSTKEDQSHKVPQGDAQMWEHSIDRIGPADQQLGSLGLGRVASGFSFMHTGTRGCLAWAARANRARRHQSAGREGFGQLTIAWCREC